MCLITKIWVWWIYLMIWEQPALIGSKRAHQWEMQLVWFPRVMVFSPNRRSEILSTGSRLASSSESPMSADAPRPVAPNNTEAQREKSRHCNKNVLKKDDFNGTSCSHLNPHLAADPTVPFNHGSKMRNYTSSFPFGGLRWFKRNITFHFCF